MVTISVNIILANGPNVINLLLGVPKQLFLRGGISLLKQGSEDIGTYLCSSVIFKPRFPKAAKVSGNKEGERGLRIVVRGLSGPCLEQCRSPLLTLVKDNT